MRTQAIGFYSDVYSLDIILFSKQSIFRNSLLTVINSQMYNKNIYLYKCCIK